MGTIENLIEQAENAWDTFRATYHSMLDATKNGESGWTASDGQPLLYLRSVTRKGAQLLDVVTESWNGSGELPDRERLRSLSVSMGAEPEDFICMLWSLMGSMDVVYSMRNGDFDLVTQVFERMNGEKAPRTMLANMFSKKVSTSGPITSVQPVPAGKSGKPSKKDRGSDTMARRRPKTAGRMPAKSSISPSGRKKRSVRKTRKSERK